MTRTKLSPALAARLLAEAQRPAPRLELYAPDYRYDQVLRRDPAEDQPDALVLEADGSFSEIRD